MAAVAVAAVAVAARPGVAAVAAVATTVVMAAAAAMDCEFELFRRTESEKKQEKTLVWEFLFGIEPVRPRAHTKFALPRQHTLRAQGGNTNALTRSPTLNHTLGFVDSEVCFAHGSIVQLRARWGLFDAAVALGSSPRRW